MNNNITMTLNVDDLILQALREDISSEDVTTNAVMPKAQKGEAQLICKQDGVIAGLFVFKRVFELLDSDNHKVIHQNKPEARNHGPIKIGNHVWVAAFSHILKNSTIPDGSIVAYHSVVTRQFEGEKLLLGGFPAKVIEEQIEWAQ